MLYASRYEHSTRFRRWLACLFNFVRAGGIPARIVADERRLIAGGFAREHRATAVGFGQPVANFCRAETH